MGTCDLYEDAFSYSIVGTLPGGTTVSCCCRACHCRRLLDVARVAFFAVQYDAEWFAVLPDKAGADEAATVKSLLDAVVVASAGIPSVSYTHLTLPTIYSV